MIEEWKRVRNFWTRQQRNPSLLISTGFTLFVLFGCSSDPVHGPDKQFGGTLYGAATGAGAGAVTGFQLGAGTGPGALVGAGFGAVAGGVQGAVKDSTEDDLLRLAVETRRERARAYAQEVLAESLERRIALHPTREIYPADLFFYGDDTRLCAGGRELVSEIARNNRNRLPWSRLAIVAYVRSLDKNSEYAVQLASRRLEELGDHFVRAGIDPRRIETRPVLVREPIFVDPLDDPSRYSQAIEIVPIDR